MSLPTQITWRGMEPSAALETRIRELVKSLEKFSSKIVRCHVVIDLPHKHSHQGRIYEVRIQISTPGAELIAQREHHERHTHEDPYIAVRDAFRAVQRQLEDYERERRGDVKRHAPVPMGITTEPGAHVVEQSGEPGPPETNTHPGSVS
jgi:ribosome-associated translation inhibitor RaiA